MPEREAAAAGRSPQISVIVPVFNEQGNISSIHARITDVFEQLDYDLDLVFVNDGSVDATFGELVALRKKDPRVRVLDLSRNFGKEIALTAGLRSATGGAALMIDADGQHPPELIPELLRCWEDGAEVVVAVRNGGQSRSKRVSSWFYYRILNSIAERKVTPGSTDFRLLDRVVIDAFNGFTERNRITRGLVDWLGFRRADVPFEAAARAQGTASYSLPRLVRLAFDSFVSMSLFPLRVAGYLGVFITVLASGLGAFMAVESWILDDPLNLNFSGTALLAAALLFLVGIVLVCLGLISLYIANIHTEVINRPLYVERRRDG